MNPPNLPQLDGVHHVKLPVRDLAVSVEWYVSRLGYRRRLDFVEQGRLMGVTMTHAGGGPTIALRLDPELAARAAGFDYFSIGVPGKEAIEQLAERLTNLGEQHAGVHFATIGWTLPMLHDPDGHEVRFYTTDHHTELGDEVIVVEDPRETAQRRELELAG
jgi:catechol 2,3-dioxygenase-like lactoylglutathione lyase family enzyme